MGGRVGGRVGASRECDDGIREQDVEMVARVREGVACTCMHAMCMCMCMRMWVCMCMGVCMAGGHAAHGACTVHVPAHARHIHGA